MIEYALSSPQWNSGRLSFYVEQLLCRLLGCGSELTLDQVAPFRRSCYRCAICTYLGRSSTFIATKTMLPVSVGS